ncbi:MAG: HD domain-containing protein [bacterium]
MSDKIYHTRKIVRKPDIRGDYFRDQTAIIHATPFRRLKYKTQVFFSPQNDHICTRIEHVLHVSTIASTICKGLDLDIELAQAIALGHDLGHAPFGHIGEKALDSFTGDIGGFVHEIHSLKVADKITRDGKGLNLTYAVRDGIVSHCGEDFRQTLTPDSHYRNLDNIDSRQKSSVTYEGCVVRFSDKIAYLGRDIEDAIIIGLITIDDVPKIIRKNLGSTNGEIIDTLVKDVIKTSQGTNQISFSDKKYELMLQLKEFNYTYIYNNPAIIKNNEIITRLLEQLFLNLIRYFKKGGFDKNYYHNTSLNIARHFGKFILKRKQLYEKSEYPERCVVDFIAGMTDSYAYDAAREIMFPKPL